MSAVLPPAQQCAVLAGIKATPSGWPPASLDPGSGRAPQAASGRPANNRNNKTEVSTVSGDCRVHGYSSRAAGCVTSAQIDAAGGSWSAEITLAHGRTC